MKRVGAVNVQEMGDDGLRTRVDFLYSVASVRRRKLSDTRIYSVQNIKLHKRAQRTDENVGEKNSMSLLCVV